MNTLTPDGQSVLDSTGKPYALDVPHPMPLPVGILLFDHGPNLQFYWGAAIKRWTWEYSPVATHWLLRPEPPAPKTQEEMDEEAFEDWKTRFAHNEISWWNTVQKAWHAGVAHGRKQS